MSHENAIKAVAHYLFSILFNLGRETSENDKPTGHDLFKFMKCNNCVATAHLLSDILPHLSHPSQIFQKEDVDLSLIQPSLKSTNDAIEESIGPNLSQVDEVISVNLKDFQFTVN